MPKIQLGKAPESFTHKVVFPLIEGGQSEITVHYRNRTRSEFAAFIAELYPQLKDGFTDIDPVGLDVVAGAARGIESDVKHILGVLKSWDFSDPLDAANVKRLADEYPAAATAIIADYRQVITEGRTKN